MRKAREARGLGFELDVPIRVADDAFPRCFARDLGEKKLRRPTRCARPAQEPKTGLLHESISLLEIALQAGDDAVLPMGSSAPRAGNDMVDRQVLSEVLLPAELASIAISLEKILSIEGHASLGDFSVALKNHDLGNANAQAHGVNTRNVLRNGEIRPRLKAMQRAIRRVHYAGNVLVYERQRVARGRQMNGNPVPIEHQSRLFEHHHRGHGSRPSI